MSYPPYLISHEATRSNPASTQLEKLVLWDYTFALHSEGDVTFEVLWNEEQSVAYTMVAEEVDGIARMRVTAAMGCAPIVRLSEEMTEEMTLEELREVRTRTIVFERLDAIDVQCARASAGGARFPSPVAPTIEIVEPMTIGDAPESIAAHLTSFVEKLLGESSVATRPIEIKCFYGYTLSEMPITVPVVLVPRQDVAIHDAELFAQIESTIRQWLAAAQPPATNGRLSFDITIWSTVRDTPLLRFADVSLPMGVVAI